MSNFFKKYVFFIILGLIFLIAIFLRFYQLGNNPPSIDWDEASLGYNAYSILKTGADEYGNTFPLSFRSFDDYKPPVYIYLTVPSIVVFGLTEFAVRLPAAIIGVFSILIVYFLTKEIFIRWDRRFKEYVALAASFFLAISPWHLQFSRAAFEGNVGLFFLLSGILFFLIGIKKPFFFILASLFFVVSLYSYHSFRLINPLILIVLAVFFFKDLLRLKFFTITALILFVLLSIPVYSSFVHPQGTGSRFSMVTIFSDSTLAENTARQVAYDKSHNDFFNAFLHNRRFIYIGAITKGYFDHFGIDFLFFHGDGGVQHHAVNMGMLYVWDLPFILLGIYFFLKKFDKRLGIFLALFLLAPLPSAITTGTPHPVRAIAMIPAFQIFSAVGFVGLMYEVLKQKRRIVKIGIILVVVGTLSANIVYYLKQYYIFTPVEYGYFWQYGNKEIISYAKDHESEYKKIIISYRYDQPYIYYLFYNKTDPFWYQKNWDFHKNGVIDRFRRVIGKYEFKNIEFTLENQNKNVLLIGTPDEIPKNSQTITEVKFPDGRIAYRISHT